MRAVFGAIPSRFEAFLFGTRHIVQFTQLSASERYPYRDDGDESDAPD
ncbi:MAG: hypothetical protein AAFR64_13890 [Pseudomonadota bacterium]